MDRDTYLSLRSEAEKWKRIQKSSKRIERTIHRPQIDAKKNPFRESMQLRDARELIKYNKNPQFYKVPAKSRKIYVGGPTSELKKRTTSKFKAKNVVTFGHRPGSASRHLDVLTMGVSRKQRLTPLGKKGGKKSQMVGGGLLSANELKDLLFEQPRAAVHESLSSNPLNSSLASSSIATHTFTQSVLSSELGVSPSIWSEASPKPIRQSSFEGIPSIPSDSSISSSFTFGSTNGRSPARSKRKKKKKKRMRNSKSLDNVTFNDSWMERKSVQLPENICRDASTRNVAREMQWNGKLYDPTVSEGYKEKHPMNQINAVLYERNKPTTRGINTIKKRTARINELNIQHPFCRSRQLEDAYTLMAVNDAGKGHHGKWHLKQTSVVTPREKEVLRKETMKLFEFDNYMMQMDKDGSYKEQGNATLADGEPAEENRMDRHPGRPRSFESASTTPDPVTKLYGLRVPEMPGTLPFPGIPDFDYPDGLRHDDDAA